MMTLGIDLTHAHSVIAKVGIYANARLAEWLMVQTAATSTMECP